MVVEGASLLPRISVSPRKTHTTFVLGVNIIPKNAY